MKKLIIFLLAAGSAFGQGQVRQSVQRLGTTNGFAVTFNWIGDAVSGAVPTTPAKLQELPQMQGYRIVNVETVPSSPPPTAGYSIQVLDSGGVDVLGGAATSLSSTFGQSFGASASSAPILGSFSLAVSGQTVGGAQGSVIVFLMPTAQIIGITTGSSSSGSGSSGLVLVSSDYNFKPQTPGTPLVGGTPATISMVPCPAGLVGDSSESLYLSGGTGTAEYVIVTALTGTSPGAACQVSFTPANSHSGAYLVSSATSGVKEAADTLTSNGGTVVIPTGVTPFYGPMIWTKNQLSVQGVGLSSHVVYQGTAGGDIFYFNGLGLSGATGYHNSISNLYIDVTDLGGASSVGVHINGQVEFSIQNSVVNNVNTGIKIEGQLTTSVVRIVNDQIAGLTPSTGIGIYQLGGADVYITNSSLEGFYSEQPHAGIEISFSTGTKIVGCDVFATGNGLILNPTSGQQTLAVDSTSNWYDSPLGGNALLIAPTGSGIVKQITSVQDWFTSASGNGIEIDAGGTTDGVMFADSRVFNNGQDGILYNAGTNVSFTNVVSAGNSQSSTGTYHGLGVAAGAGGFHVLGGTYGSSYGWGNTQGYGILITAGASDHFSIEGATLTANVTGLIGDGSTGVHKIITSLQGITDAAPPSSTPTATFAATSPYSLFQVSGTATVTSITGGWIGRTITLYKTDTGTLTVLGHSMTQNTSLTLTSPDGTNWY